jgi:hypothetical protein
MHSFESMSWDFLIDFLNFRVENQNGLNNVNHIPDLAWATNYFNKFHLSSVAGYERIEG